MDSATADSTRKFTTSVVLGKDWIPRLTLNTFERLRDEMVSRFLTISFFLQGPWELHVPIAVRCAPWQPASGSAALSRLHGSWL